MSTVKNYEEIYGGTTESRWRVYDYIDYYDGSVVMDRAGCYYRDEELIWAHVMYIVLDGSVWVMMDNTPLEKLDSSTHSQPKHYHRRAVFTDF